MSYIEVLNDNLHNTAFQFKLKIAKFNPKTLSLDIELVYPDEIILNKEIKEIVTKISKSEFPQINNVNIKYIKAYFDESVLQKELKSFIRKNYSKLITDDITFNEDSRTVNIICDEIFKDYVEISDLVSNCQEYIYKRFNENLNIDIDFVKINVNNDNESSIVVPKATIKSFTAPQKEQYIGELITSDPVYISSITEPVADIVVCGKITRFSDAMTRPKIGKSGNEIPAKKYFKFTVSDFSGDINVLYFPAQTNLPKAEKLAVNIDVLIFGKIEEDAFSGGLVLRPHSINLCVLPNNFLELKIKKALPEKYTKVFPQEIVSLKQINLFDMSGEEQVNQYLRENTFIVFDFETTGLDGVNDKIIEIGAVKIENGKPTQTFSCLVNPRMHIPSESSAINNIFDSDVEDAPTIEEVLPDFYKFCYGNILVAYNIDFDYKFLSVAGKQNGYDFNNKKIDALYLARKALVGQLKNFRLVTVAAHLGVSLINAHRAVDDALATAEVFIKLITNNPDIIN